MSESEDKKEGAEAERLFDAIIQKVHPNWECRKISDWEYDRLLRDKTGEMRVEVKGRKKIQRYDSDFCYDEVWVELRNNNGSEGWLLRDEIDVLAFRMEKGFVSVDRQTLLELVMRLIDWDDLVERPESALYRGYSRIKYGRNDLTGRILRDDLLSIPHEVWEM